MPKYSNKKKSGAKKFLVALLVAVALVALFLISFWVTSVVLDANQRPSLFGREEHETETATPEPTYEELVEMVEERDEKIAELEEELERYQGKNVQATIAPSQTEKPAAMSTAKPTEAPTAKPTEAPTAKPTAKPTTAPTAEPATDTDTAPDADTEE